MTLHTDSGTVSSAAAACTLSADAGREQVSDERAPGNARAAGGCGRLPDHDSDRGGRCSAGPAAAREYRPGRSAPHRATGGALHRAAQLAIDSDAYDEAERRCVQVIALARERATARLAEGATLLQVIGNPFYLPWRLEGLAGVATVRGQWERAVWLCGARDALHGGLGLGCRRRTRLAMRARWRLSARRWERSLSPKRLPLAGCYQQSR